MFVGIALVLVDPLLVAMIAVPGVLFVQRVGGASLNISVCDVLTVAGTVVALPMLRADMRVTRRLLWIGVLFQAVLLLVVVAHPNQKSIFEWLHRCFLVDGSITIGAALGRARRTNAAVVVFLYLASALAIAAIFTSVAHGFAPADPFRYQKNFVGSMTASAVLIATVRPAWLRLRQYELFLITVLCAAGLLASQSRGAMLALAAALVVAAAREGRLSARNFFAVVIIGPLVVFAVASVQRQRAQHQINSLTYRATQGALALREWHLSPWFGQGLRFFNQPGALIQVDPPNVFQSTLAEGGLLGMLALILLVCGALLALQRLPPETAAIAIVFIVGRFVHGIFDVYWVAGTTTLPWIIVGIVCGTADADAANDRPVSQPSRASPTARLSRS